MDEKPADAFRTKEDSSLVRAVKAVADGEADAVVSAGNTGAMLAAGRVLLRRVPGPLAIAVPKRKTSKSRRDKRRATHAISAPKVNVCPNCGQPKRPHRVCPTCGTYKGREVEPLRTHAP